MLAAFAATVVERGRLAPEPDPSVAPGLGDHTLLGLSLDAGSLQGLLLHDLNAAYRGAEDVDRTTIGGQWEGTVGPGPRYGIEGAYQFGTQLRATSSEDIAAWFAGGRLGWNRTLGPLESIELGVDWLSGDVDPSDGRYSASIRSTRPITSSTASWISFSIQRRKRMIGGSSTAWSLSGYSADHFR